MTNDQDHPSTNASTSLTRRKFILRLAASLPSCALIQSRVAAKPKLPPLKILTCNIRLPLEGDDETGDGWEDRKDLCADTILSRHPHVICLQECYSVQLDYLKSRMPEFDSFGLANPAPVFNPVNAILFSRSRFEIVSAGGFWLSEKPHVAGTRSWDSASPRFVNWVHLKERNFNQEFRVWNTHLDHRGQVAREEQARLIVEGSKTSHPENFPQLLAGDFNADATNAAITIVKEGGWVDTFSSVHGAEEPGFTYHRFLGRKFPEQVSKDQIRGKIDWIFYRGAVRTLSAEVIRDGRNNRYPSDHYFVSAEVMLGQ